MDIQIVAGILWRGNEILLVEQQGADDPAPSWALPGGRVEDGELLTDALIREVREETGLAVHRIGSLAYLVQHTRLDSAGILTVFVFEIAEWAGEIRTNDPDKLILQARFMQVNEAIHLLETTLPWQMMLEPVVEYLSGNAKPGTLWTYRNEP